MTRRRTIGRRGLVWGAAVAACVGCAPRVAESPRRVPTTESRGGEPTRDAGRIARVALAVSVARPVLNATGEWALLDGTGRTLVARIPATATWALERRGGEVRAVGAGGATPWRADAIVAHPLGSGEYLVFNGRRWRGDVWTHPTSGGLTVVNRLPVEDYLRGVVPLELNTFAPRDGAALEAQAIAARSYVYSRMPEFEPRDVAIRQAALPYDVRATVSDQVYGGRDAEHPVADQAIANTAGFVLRYGGAVVTAPYHSACGGSTAEPGELWRSESEPYLQRVSDRVPGTVDRYYCDIAPRFRWTRSWDESELRGILERYLRATANASPMRAVSGVAIRSRTGSGRVDVLDVSADERRAELRGNDIRFTLRTLGGEILPSTYFSVETERDAEGHLARVTLRGNGNGHGVGMCQWGAVGRARAGQSARTILRAYFPGVSVEPVE